MLRVILLIAVLLFFRVDSIKADSTLLTPKEIYFQQQINLLLFGYLEERVEAVANLRIFKEILAVRSLITVLRGDNFPNSVVNNPILKYFVSQTLASMGHEIAIKPLIEEYKEYEANIGENDKPFLDERTEYSILMALGEMLHSLGSLPFSTESYDLLKSALSHKNYYIRASAAEGLKRANRKESIEVLVGVLQNEKSEYTKVVILNAILSLDKGSGVYFNQLITHLKSSDSNVRFKTSVAIGELDIKPAEPFLKSAILIEDDLNVRVQMKKDLVILKGFRIPDVMPGQKN